MPKELKNIEDVVMNKIHHGNIKIKPRIYFIIGSIFAFIGLVSTVLVSTFLVGLIRFSMHSNFGYRAQYKLDMMISNFPWWLILFAIIGLTVGIWLIRKYDFSYKIKPIFIIIIFTLSIIFTGMIIDMIGFNDTLLHRGPMRGMMRGYIINQNIPPNFIK